MASMSVNSTSLTEAIRDDVEVDVRREIGFQRRQLRLDAIGGGDDVRIRQLEDQQQDGALAVGPGSELAVLRP
jgi:hypothetical protein